MIVATFGLTQTGAVRDENQDSYLIDPEQGLFAVADGLGGLPNGAAASRITLALLRDAVTRQPEAPLGMLVQKIHQDAITAGFELNEHGFGTTLTVLRVHPRGDEAVLVHVGDSGAYRIHDRKAELLTAEHTVGARMLAEALEMGIPADEIPPIAHHTLTQCIGQKGSFNPQVVKVPLQTGDRIFLVTDGVTKPLSEADLQRGLTCEASIEQTCQRLSFRIEAAGSPDNYTMVALQFA